MGAAGSLACNPKASAQLRGNRLTVYVTQAFLEAVNCPDLQRLNAYAVVVRGLREGELMVEVFQDPSSSEFDAKAPSTTVTVL
jgi:hypothetical protein